MVEVVAVSGGKDSTAMMLRLCEVEPNPDRKYIITPTGDELPKMADHWALLEHIAGKKFITPDGPSLPELINHFNALPNPRMRWCTRMIKIQPVLSWIKQQPSDTVMCVGLRADEEERRGILGDINIRFPLREWGWGIDDVLTYLDRRNIKVPPRTDCARCPYQRLIEWYNLWRDYPDIYQSAVDDEIKTGYTFRSPSRDTWPASLLKLREEFAAGRIPKIIKRKKEADSCRVCRL